MDVYIETKAKHKYTKYKHKYSKIKNREKFNNDKVFLELKYYLDKEFETIDKDKYLKEKKLYNDTIFDKGNKKREKLKKMAIVVNTKKGQIKFSKHNMSIKIRRSIRYMNFFRGWLKWCRQNNIRVPNASLYLYIADVHYFENDTLPVCLMAKPANRAGILIPEDTIYCTEIRGIKDKVKCLDHDELAKLMIDKCILPFQERDPTMFFKGADTGKTDKWAIRNMLKKQYENDNSISIQLKGAQLPIYDFCKYMILLNLPGNQPWAYRFREILLMGSLVVNISVYASYDNGKTWNDPWIHFWSCLFNPNEHYVDLEYRWMENNEEYNKKQNQKLFSDLENLNKDILKNREKYSKIAYNGSKKMRQLSMDTIYRYITYIFEKVERFDI